MCLTPNPFSHVLSPAKHSVSSVEGRSLFPARDRRPSGAPDLVGLMYLPLASVPACNEALHLSGWSEAGQPEGGGELVPGLLLPPRSGF